MNKLAIVGNDGDPPLMTIGRIVLELIYIHGPFDSAITSPDREASCCQLTLSSTLITCRQPGTFEGQDRKRS